MIPGSARKVVKAWDGSLVGGAGSLQSVEMFLDWWLDPTEDKPTLLELTLENFNGIVISPDGKKIYIYEDSGYPFEIKSPFHSIGVGAPIAYGAFEMGATAEEAVKTAIKYDNTCGGKVQKVSL